MHDFHKRRAVPPINMSINNIPIDIVPHFNYLGIILMNIYHGKPMLQWSLGNYKKLMVF